MITLSNGYGIEDLEQLSLVLSSSENSLVKEEDRTLGLYESSIAMMRAQIRELADKNRTLCMALVTQESQHREIDLLHTAEITALQEENRSSKAVIESMRQEMLETMQKAHEMVQATLTAKEAAVRVATELADARVAAAKQEVATQMQGQRRELLIQIRERARLMGNSVEGDCVYYAGLISAQNPDIKYNVPQAIRNVKGSQINPFQDWLAGIQ